MKILFHSGTMILNTVLVWSQKWKLGELFEGNGRAYCTFKLMTFCKSNQFSMLIQSHRIDFLGWNDVETTLIQPVGPPSESVSCGFKSHYLFLFSMYHYFTNLTFWGILWLWRLGLDIVKAMEWISWLVLLCILRHLWVMSFRWRFNGNSRWKRCWRSLAVDYWTLHLCENTEYTLGIKVRYMFLPYSPVANSLFCREQAYVKNLQASTGCHVLFYTPWFWTMSQLLQMIAKHKTLSRAVRETAPPFWLKKKCILTAIDRYC